MREYGIDYAVCDFCGKEFDLEYDSRYARIYASPQEEKNGGGYDYACSDCLDREWRRFRLCHVCREVGVQGLRQVEFTCSGCREGGYE